MQVAARMPVYSPVQVAAMMMRMTQGQADPEVIADGYIKAACKMREYAAKAAASPNGVYRGMTSSRALELAAESDLRAVSVPAEIRKLMGI